MSRNRSTARKVAASVPAEDVPPTAPNTPVTECQQDGNIKYQDVRQIYSLWRRAEAQLQQKTKELNELRGRTSQLKAAHVDFSSKLSALESVKQLSVQFQNQIAQLNLAVSEANDRERKVTAVNQRLEEQLAHLSDDRHKLAQELADMKSAIKEQERENNRLVVLLQQEREAVLEQQRQKEAVELQHDSHVEVMDKLRNDNVNLSVRNDMLEGRMGSLSSQLEDAASQVESLFKHVNSQQMEACKDMEMRQEMEQLRMDNSRLARLLFAVPQYKQFRLTWNDSDGLAFIGPGRRASSLGNSIADNDEQETMPWASYHPELSMSKTDAWFAASLSELGRSLGGADCANSEPEEMSAQRGWSELMSMSASYQDDPFPLQSSIAELSSWVPKSVTVFSRAFMDQTAIPKEAIHEFLRRTNQEWYSRELSHAKRIKDFYKAQLKDLQRQMQHAIPYTNVIALKKVQRLEQELRAARIGKRTRSRSRSLGQHVHADVATGDEQQTYVDMELRSRERMLQASLSSLEQLAKRVQTMSQLSDNAGVPTNSLQLDDIDDTIVMPTQQFLNGAMWVSRNLGMIIEDLGEAVTTAQQNSKEAVSEALQETVDPEQRHRLVLLQFNSLLSEIEERMLDCRINLRGLVQALSKLRPGDMNKLKKIDQSLPLHCLPDELFDQKPNTPRTKSPSSSPFRSPRRPVGQTKEDPLLSTLLSKIQELQFLTTARKSVQFVETPAS